MQKITSKETKNMQAQHTVFRTAGYGELINGEMAPGTAVPVALSRQHRNQVFVGKALLHPLYIHAKCKLAFVCVRSRAKSRPFVLMVNTRVAVPRAV